MAQYEQLPQSLGNTPAQLVESQGSLLGSLNSANAGVTSASIAGASALAGINERAAEANANRLSNAFSSLGQLPEQMQKMKLGNLEIQRQQAELPAQQEAARTEYMKNVGLLQQEVGAQSEFLRQHPELAPYMNGGQIPLLTNAFSLSTGGNPLYSAQRNAGAPQVAQTGSGSGQSGGNYNAPAGGFIGPSPGPGQSGFITGLPQAPSVAPSAPAARPNNVATPAIDRTLNPTLNQGPVGTGADISNPLNQGNINPTPSSLPPPKTGSVAPDINSVATQNVVPPAVLNPQTPPQALATASSLVSQPTSLSPVDSNPVLPNNGPPYTHAEAADIHKTIDSRYKNYRPEIGTNGQMTGRTIAVGDPKIGLPDQPLNHLALASYVAKNPAAWTRDQAGNPSQPVNAELAGIAPPAQSAAQNGRWGTDNPIAASPNSPASLTPSVPLIPPRQSALAGLPSGAPLSPLMPPNASGLRTLPPAATMPASLAAAQQVQSNIARESNGQNPLASQLAAGTLPQSAIVNQGGPLWAGGPGAPPAPFPTPPGHVTMAPPPGVGIIQTAKGPMYSMAANGTPTVDNTPAPKASLVRLPTKPVDASTVPSGPIPLTQSPYGANGEIQTDGTAGQDIWQKNYGMSRDEVGKRFANPNLFHYVPGQDPTATRGGQSDPVADVNGSPVWKDSQNGELYTRAGDTGYDHWRYYQNPSIPPLHIEDTVGKSAMQKMQDMAMQAGVGGTDFQNWPRDRQIAAYRQAAAILNEKDNPDWVSRINASENVVDAATDMQRELDNLKTPGDPTGLHARSTISQFVNQVKRDNAGNIPDNWAEGIKKLTGVDVKNDSLTPVTQSYQLLTKMIRAEEARNEGITSRIPSDKPSAESDVEGLGRIQDPNFDQELSKYSHIAKSQLSALVDGGVAQNIKMPLKAVMKANDLLDPKAPGKDESSPWTVSSDKIYDQLPVGTYIRGTDSAHPQIYRKGMTKDAQGNWIVTPVKSK